MRRFFLLLLIALLPLRGWVGEAMAGEMLAQQMIAPVLIASHQGGTPTSALFDFQSDRSPTLGPGHSAAHGDHHAPDPVAQDASAASAPCADHGTDPSQHGEAGGLSACPTCASCQACSAVALQFTPTAVPLTGFTPPRPDSGEARFASVLPTQGFKPPIS